MLYIGVMLVMGGKGVEVYEKWKAKNCELIIRGNVNVYGREYKNTGKTCI